MEAPTRTILVLGAGVGGLVVANELRRALPRAHRITLVDRESSYLFAPSLLWLMTGDRTRERISRPLARLGRKGIEIVRGEIERIDAGRCEAAVGGNTLTGDYLVIALGAEYAPETIPGLPEAGHNFYTLAGAERLRDTLAGFQGGRLVVLTASPMYKCPPAPYEAAMLLDSYCRRRRIRDRTEISMYAAEPGPMALAGPEVSKELRAIVESKRIAYFPNHQITAADPERRELKFENGSVVPYDLLAYVPPHRAPLVVRDSDLVAESGWIPVDRTTLATRHPGVYAIGDVVGIPLTAGKPLPKAGVFAHGQAEVVARNIARAIRGGGKAASYAGAGVCFVETGDGKAGIGTGNFFAEPAPEVVLKPPAWRWHLAKVLFERHWLWRWF